MDTQTADHPAAASGPPPSSATPPLRLTMTRQHSVRAIRAAIKIGEAIANQRIRERWELDQARAEKLEWVQRTTDLLKRLFNSGRVADWCNDWVGKILPEYAELGAFIEQFEQEMQHRLSRLRKVLKKVEDIPDVSQNVIHGIRSEPEADDTPDMQPAEPSAERAPAPQATNAADTIADNTEDECPMPMTLNPTAPTSQATVTTVTASPAAPQRCLLICREDNPPVREAIGQFASRLELPLTALVGPAPEELDHARGAFAILMPGSTGLDPFELGFCLGRLGSKRLCVVTPPETSAGDTRGLPTIVFDAGEAWQLQLARQLRRSGLNVDLNRLV